MKYYKLNDRVYAFESDGSQDFLITKDFIKMNADEVDRHINPSKYLSDEEKRDIYIQSLRPLNRKQFKSMFVLNGFNTSDVEDKIQSISDNVKKQLMLIEWQDADSFARGDELVAFLSDVFGLSEDDTNKMWEDAMKL